MQAGIVCIMRALFTAAAVGKAWCMIFMGAFFSAVHNSLDTGPTFL